VLFIMTFRVGTLSGDGKSFKAGLITAKEVRIPQALFGEVF